MKNHAKYLEHGDRESVTPTALVEERDILFVVYFLSMSYNIHSCYPAIVRNRDLDLLCGEVVTVRDERIRAVTHFLRR